MVRVNVQNIPSEFSASYISSLQASTNYKGLVLYGQKAYGFFLYSGGSNIYVRERYPFRLPSMQGEIAL